MLILMTLDFVEFEIHEADNGPTGLRLARALKPDLVLLDVMMPGELDGYQVCEAIKSDPALSAVSVVMLTARGQQADLLAGEKAGCDAYLTKPFSPLELIDTVEGMLARTANAAG
ncbi:response regulator [Azoarcus taiwanensis]|uniref:Response regulator n=2 Tax=Azoarcus taiwanensis TaxID=666964 RepID=A0A972F9I6_9RHOO|nr:response regulator [Azoarcus taiwanensis]